MQYLENLRVCVRQLNKLLTQIVNVTKIEVLNDKTQLPLYDNLKNIR